MFDWLSIGAQVFSTVLKAGGQFESGNAALTRGKRVQQQADWEAAQLEQNAGQAQAASQIAALNQQRDTNYIISKAIAYAAASGGGASDPTIINNIARIAQEGKYREGVARYEGDDRARAMNLRAAGTRYAGQTAMADAREAKSASNLSGFATAFTGVSTLLTNPTVQTMWTKYGGDTLFGKRMSAPTSFDPWQDEDAAFG